MSQKGRERKSAPRPERDIGAAVGERTFATSARGGERALVHVRGPDVQRFEEASADFDHIRSTRFRMYLALSDATALTVPIVRRLSRTREQTWSY